MKTSKKKTKEVHMNKTPQCLSKSAIKRIIKAEGKMKRAFAAWDEADMVEAQVVLHPLEKKLIKAFDDWRLILCNQVGLVNRKSK